ncbi:hypothetical protein PsorP6_011054 [Peronosclerospora sorghi]|uniref:Uncharacterized protein n=1 Tax=Peronosclerospora sorghi TaxID=230839 RepID=A0ACC0VVA8_9STRA|nr:hypothetical protein PsorP6_011054 [Peronosclerospora sorghi]
MVEAEVGAPLAAHFETKRRIVATVTKMENSGEKIEEATYDEILEAATNSAETVFKFDFSLDEAADSHGKKKRNRNRKRNQTRRRVKKNTNGDDHATRGGSARDAREGRTEQPFVRFMFWRRNRCTINQSTLASSFLKLRPATGTESEVTEMHLR